MRGVWKHLKCGMWNPYVGRDGSSAGRREIDSRCQLCGQRVRFFTHRRSKRGRKSKITFQKRPEHMPRIAIVRECRQRNSHIPKDAIIHFQKLGEIVEIERHAMPGSINRRWEDSGYKYPGYTFRKKRDSNGG